MTEGKAIATALVAAQGEFEAVAKDASNPFFSSHYASLPAVVKAATPILQKNGLAVSQLIGFDGLEDTLKTILIHESGECIETTARLHLVKNDPQGHGSAITYMRRYAYMAILGLVADEDDDGNAASSPVGKVEHGRITEIRPSPKQQHPSNIDAVDGSF